MAKEPSLKRLRTRYGGQYQVQKPASADERSWEIFTAYFYEQRTLVEIAKSTGLAPGRVCRLLRAVDAQLETPRGAGGTSIGPDSPLEDLGFSVRTRNALHSLGCENIQDVARLDLSGPVRGIGLKTRSEVLMALRSSGFYQPGKNGAPDSGLGSLERSLERMHSRINAALGAVAKEIQAVQRKLRRKVESGSGGSADGVTPA